MKKWNNTIFFNFKSKFDIAMLTVQIFKEIYKSYFEMRYQHKNQKFFVKGYL